MGLSKIKSVQANGSYESKFDGSTMFTFEIALEDGTLGEVSAKTQDRWKIGDEVEYSLTETQYGKKLKLSRPQQDFSNASFGGGGNYQSPDHRQHLIMNQWAIRMAMEWEMNQCPPDKIRIRQAIALAKQLKEFAMDLDNVDVSLQAETVTENIF
jgi:catechol-2,3-dioxygenase